MFGFVHSQGSQHLEFWPKTRSNELISANISEHVRTLFDLFACPTTEQVLPLSIRQGELFVGPPEWSEEGRLYAARADLSGVEPPRVFLEFFLEFFGAREWWSARSSGAAIWVHGISKGSVMAVRRPAGSKVKWRGAGVCLCGAVATLAVSTQTPWATFCDRSKSPLRRVEHQIWQRENQGEGGQCQAYKDQSECRLARAGFPLKPAVEACIRWLRAKGMGILGASHDRRRMARIHGEGQVSF
jgi:hypothetical protein